MADFCAWFVVYRNIISYVNFGKKLVIIPPYVLNWVDCLIISLESSDCLITSIESNDCSMISLELSDRLVLSIKSSHCLRIIIELSKCLMVSIELSDCLIISIKSIDCLMKSVEYEAVQCSFDWLILPWNCSREKIMEKLRPCVFVSNLNICDYIFNKNFLDIIDQCFK